MGENWSDRFHVGQLVDVDLTDGWTRATVLSVGSRGVTVIVPHREARFARNRFYITVPERIRPITEREDA